MEEKPGFGFRPYDEELVGYYLHHKILGNDCLVDGIISVFDICSVDPWDLRFKSRDPVLYFFSRRENKYVNGNQQSRKTRSGFWKLTGKAVDVKDQWGHLSGSRGKIIGQKRVLVFVRGKNNNSLPEKTPTEWVVHELHYTLLPEHKRTYVICRLEYKGEDVNILSANATYPTPTMANSASSVVDQSFQGYYSTLSENDQPFFQGYSEYFNPISEYDLANHQSSYWLSNAQEQEQVAYAAPYHQGDADMLQQVVEENWSSLVDERRLMREDSNHYRPKKPVTRVYPEDTSDTDSDSMIGGDAWSSTDSVGSKDGPYNTPKDDHTPSLIPVEPLHPQELPKQLQAKEKKMAEDSIKKAPSTSTVKEQSWIVLEEISQRTSQWTYLWNLIICFLLSISIIAWIILVG